MGWGGLGFGCMVGYIFLLVLFVGFKDLLDSFVVALIALSQ